MSLKDLAVVSDTYETLRNLGVEFQKKTVESLLSFARIVYVLREKANNDEDVDFNALCEEYWGLSQSGASQFAKTGQFADRLEGYADRLPSSSRSLYELTQLPLEVLDRHIGLGDITPASTVNDIQAIKNTLKEEKAAKKSKKKKEVDTEDNPFNVSAEDEDGNLVDATLVDENGEEIKPKKSTQMSIAEALVIFGIDMQELYMQVLMKGEVEKDTLNKAFYVLTGEKL